MNLGMGISLATGLASGTTSSDAVIMAGQSNAWLVYDQAKADFENAFNGKWFRHDVTLYNGATSGSAAMEESATDPLTDPWWYDDVGLVYGTAWDTWETAANVAIAAGKKVRAIIWDQGESDFGFLASQGAPYQVRYKATLLTIFNAMRAVVGNVPVLIQPIGRRGTAIAIGNVGYQLIRDIQKTLVAENSWIHLSSDKHDFPDDTGAHLAYPGTAYATLARRQARRILSILGGGVPGGVLGPSMSSAARNDLDVTVSIEHQGGTDFTPSSAIDSFYYADEIGSITISSAVRTSANAVTLTLARYPIGAESLYTLYNHGQYITDYTKVLKDNQAEPLPLRASNTTPTNSSVYVGSSALTGVVFNRRAKELYSTGQLMPNAARTPADGSTQNVYRLKLGSSVNVGADDPTFVAAAGGVPAHLTNDGADALYGQDSTVPNFLKRLGTTSVHSYYALIKNPASWGTTATPIFYLAGGNSAGTAGFGVRYLTVSNRIRITTSDGAATGNVDIDTSALPTSTYTLFVFTYDPTTKAYKIYINAVSPNNTGTATAAKQAEAGTNVHSFFSLFTATAGWIEDGMVNHVMTNAEVSALKSYLETQYEITIF